MNNIDYNNAPYPGAEMLPFERYTIYNWVLNIIKPKTILEIGTGNGGSTYYLSKAMKELNNKGKIYTCDPSRSPCADFFKECDNVQYSPVPSDVLIKNILDKNITIDYIFFDGPEDPDIAMNDIKILEKTINPNVYFSMHDWETEKRGYDQTISTKAKNIRPYMEKSFKWKKIECLSGLQKNSSYDTMNYDSVGLCLYQYTG